MKDELILDFRRTCKVLMDEKKQKIWEIAHDSGISIPTVEKLLHTGLADLAGVQASTIAKMQDFNKKHRQDVDYSGLDAAPDVVVKAKPGIKEAREQQQREKMEEERSALMAGRHIPNFWDYMNLASSCKPSNVEVVITIKSTI